MSAGRPSMVPAIAAIAVAGLGGLGLSTLIEVGEAVSADPLAFRAPAAIVSGSTERLSGLATLVGLAAVTVALSHARGIRLAIVPGAIMYGVGALVLPAAVGEPLGAVTLVSPTGILHVAALVAETALIFGPAGVAAARRRRPLPEGLWLASGLIAAPVLASIWVMATFSVSADSDLVALVAATSAVALIGLLADSGSAGHMVAVGGAAALVVRSITGDQWAVAFTICLMAGIVSSGVADELWRRRRLPLRMALRAGRGRDRVHLGSAA